MSLQSYIRVCVTNPVCEFTLCKLTGPIKRARIKHVVQLQLHSTCMLLIAPCRDVRKNKTLLLSFPLMCCEELE